MVTDMSITLEQAKSAKDKARQLVESTPLLREANPSFGISFLAEGYGVEINFSRAGAWDTLLPPTLDGVPLKIQVVGQIGKFD